MGVFEMVVIVVFIATMGKVVNRALSRPRVGTPAAPRDRVEALEAELRANDARLAHAEERVVQLEEKIDFLENLLARPERPARLSGKGSPADN